MTTAPAGSCASAEGASRGSSWISNPIPCPSEWVNAEGLGQEYVIALRTPDLGVERHHVIGILTFGAEALSGERVYAGERLLRLMFGPAFDLSEPL